MKTMSRNFTTKEKVLFAVLGCMLIGLVFYRFFYVNLSNAVDEANAEAATLQSDLDIAKTRTMRIEKMEQQLQGIGNTGVMQKMGSYNNSKPETAFLHTVLSSVPDYTISFDDVTRDGKLIRRNFTLNFTTASYDSAEKIIRDLTSGEYRCLIGDMSCSVENGITSVTLEGTFYETMVGGTPDSALPADETETDEAVELEDFE